MNGSLPVVLTSKILSCEKRNEELINKNTEKINFKIENFYKYTEESRRSIDNSQPGVRLNNLKIKNQERNFDSRQFIGNCKFAFHANIIRADIYYR